jgi:hypothetical protein
LTKTIRFLSELQKEIEVNNKKIRDFGWIMFIVLGLIVPAIISYKNDWDITRLMTILFGISMVFFLPSMLFPKAMYPVFRAWMTIAILLGLVMTKVIITLVFYLMMTPIGLIRRMFVRDPLKLRIDENAKTYWVTRQEPVTRESYEKQY